MLRHTINLILEKFKHTHKGSMEVIVEQNLAATCDVFCSPCIFLCSSRHKSFSTVPTAPTTRTRTRTHMGDWNYIKEKLGGE